MHEIISTLQDLWQMVDQNGFHSLGPLSYVLIALLVATEGPVTTLIGAAGAAAGLLDIRFVFLATAIGNIVGDALWYSVGYASKADRLHKITGRFGLHQYHIEQLTDEMRCHATKAILVSKITFGLIIPTLVAAGLSRVPLRRWLPAVLVAETLWTVLLVTLGFHGAGAITRIEDGFRMVGAVAAVVAVTFIALYLKRRRAQLAPDEPEPRSVKPLGKRAIPHTMKSAHRHLPQSGLAKHRLAQTRHPRSTVTSSLRSRSEVLEKV